MARIGKQTRKRKPEPTIALINVVFLLLVFFLVAGTLSQAVDKSIRLVSVADAIDSLPEDVLAIRADGMMIRHTIPVSIDDVLPENPQTDSKLRIAPDKDLSAIDFVKKLSRLKEAGWSEIVLIGENVE